MAKNPAFPFYANDYLVDTLRWSRGMKSLHVDLMCESWANKKLKNEDGYPEGLNSEDKKLWSKIVHKWKLVDGCWVNEKLEKCRSDREKFLIKQSVKGKKSAAVRRGSQPEHKPKLNNGSTVVQPLEDEIEEEGFVLNYKKESNEKTFDVALTIVDESLSDVERWTNDVIDGNDVYFINMVRNSGHNLNGDLERLARDHLGLCARYKWHENIETQQAFRLSLLGHITKELNKQTNGAGIKRISGQSSTDPERNKDYRSEGF